MLGEIYHFWSISAFFRWFHVVPGVFGSFMLTYFIEPCWFSFSDSEPACKINHFWNKNASFRWLHVVTGVFGSCMLTCYTCYMEPSLFPFSGRFQFFLGRLSKCIIFVAKMHFCNWFHVVPSVFGSIKITCYIEPNIGLAGFEFPCLVK